MKKLLLLLALIILPLSASAADTYKFDPNHINITWSANHFGFSSPSGKFAESEGVVILDQASPNRSQVDITIQTDSILTGIEKFDTYLKGPNFLDVKRFPTAKFVSTKVSLRNSNIAKVDGNLTLLGITKPITLDVRLNKIGTNPFNQKQTAGFTAKATINRADFGMTFASPGVSDTVKIDIEAEAILSQTNVVSSATTSAASQKDNLSQTNADQWNIIADESKIEFIATQSQEKKSGEKSNSTLLEPFNSNTAVNPSTGSKIHGSFEKFDANIIFNPSKIADAKIQIEIDTNSVTLDFADSAAIVKKPEWLNTYSFPKATFVSKNIISVNSTSYVAFGTLTIKGKSYPVSVNFNLSNYSQIAGTATATGSFNIKRSTFGIGARKPRDANNIEDYITITFTINASK